MARIDLSIDETGLEHAVARARERNIIIPTFAQMLDPGLIPQQVKAELGGLGLYDLHPRNLFRISWHNEPREHGGLFGPPNVLEFPPSLTGTRARIIALVGKWFPIGAHKVGAAFACLVPRLVTGRFDPTWQKAVWPSTGNYARGGAYDSRLLGCSALAVVPAGMGRERFERLEALECEIAAIEGAESNVKGILDACRQLCAGSDEYVIFNQFDEFPNYMWHYSVSGAAMEEVLASTMGPGDEYRGMTAAIGSAGMVGAGDYLKQRFPAGKVVAVEALQCPTMLENGFGTHQIEGVGDRNIPWIHNVKNTDLVASIDDRAVVACGRLFNEPAGRAYLARRGVSPAFIEQLSLLGFSGIANVLSAVKFSHYYELDEHDIVLTVLTDWMFLYESHLAELREELGDYTEADAAADYARYLAGQGIDNLLELSYPDRRRVHNLKYFIWVEQQGKTEAECRAQWSERTYWTELQQQIPEIDELITEFNQRTGPTA